MTHIARLRRLLAGSAVILSAPGLTSPPVPTLTEVVEARFIDGLSVSPDGRQIAFRVTSQSVAENRTRSQWFSVAARESGAAIALGHAVTPFFVPEFDAIADPTSAWLPDSRSLFVITGEEQGHQIHRLSAHHDIRVTSDPADILSFRIDPKAGRIDYVTRRDREEIVAAQAREEREGVHLDRTIFPEGLRLTRNFLDVERRATIRRAGPPLGTDTGVDAFAGDERTKSISLSNPPGIAPAALPGRRDAIVTVDKSYATKRIESIDGHFSVSLVAGVINRNLNRPLYVVAQRQDGAAVRCQAFFCQGNERAIRQVMLNDQTGEVVIAFEASYSARIGLYGWNSVTGRTRTIVAPNGALDGGSTFNNAPCPQNGTMLICVQAGPDMPPRLVRIDLSTGRVTVLADPNAALRDRYFGRPRFIEWKDSKARPWNGILLVPQGMTGPLPLVITTYRCRGFPRGGTSYLAPEYPLLERGLAVLCANQNNEVSLESDASGAPMPAGGVKATLEAYAAIIAKLTAKKIIDPARVGIAGHSFSANAVAHAISHSTLFAAAVGGAGSTLDPTSYVVTAPTADSWRKDVFTFIGMPKPSEDSKGIWRDISPALNAGRIDTPLLLQPPENEWLFAIQLYTYMQDAGKIADMYIYPDEGHLVGRYPAHQYWRGLRSVDWFDIWLHDPRPGRADDRPEVARWRILRSDRDKAPRS